MSKLRRPARWKLLLLSISLLLTAYFSAYLVLLEGQMKLATRRGAGEVYSKDPVYSFQSDTARLLLTPANQVDRTIRRSFWTWDGRGMEIDESFAMDVPQ